MCLRLIFIAEDWLGRVAAYVSGSCVYSAERALILHQRVNSRWTSPCYFLWFCYAMDAFVALF